MFFANEQRDNVREENPGVTFGQVGKILGERWKALSEKQRAPYDAKAAADKKRYEDEKAAWNVSLHMPPFDVLAPCNVARTNTMCRLSKKRSLPKRAGCSLPSWRLQSSSHSGGIDGL
jgi:hypothetical protein